MKKTGNLHIKIDSNNIKASTSVRNLGLILDSIPIMKKQVNAIYKLGYCQLKLMSPILFWLHSLII